MKYVINFQDFLNSIRYGSQQMINNYFEINKEIEHIIIDVRRFL